MTSEATIQALSLGASAFAIGLSGAMAPGPYLTMTVTRTLRHGKLSAMLMLVGHAALEALLLIGFAFGLQHFLRQPSVARFLAFLGAAVLFWMGSGLLVGALRGTVVADLEHAEEPATQQRVGPVLHGALISLSNPYWTLWWATIGITLAIRGLEIGPVGVAAFFLGHQLADVSWYGVVVWAVSSGRRLLTPVVYRLVIGGLATFLLYMGVRFLLDGLGA